MRYSLGAIHVRCLAPIYKRIQRQWTRDRQTSSAAAAALSSQIVPSLTVCWSYSFVQRLTQQVTTNLLCEP